MPGSLKAVLLRVERLDEASREGSAADFQEEILARLLEGRNRVAMAARSGEKLPRLSDEEIRARGRELRASLRAEGIIR